MSSKILHLAHLHHFIRPEAGELSPRSPRLALSQTESTELVKVVEERLAKGGLGHITNLPGGSQTWFALSCLSLSLTKHHEDPPLSLWVSDEGFLYPEALHHYWKVPLSRIVLAKANDPPEVWRITLESSQTGLFTWIFVRTSQACDSTSLRRLQLSAERNQTKVLLLCPKALPHWPLKLSCEIKPDANVIFPKRIPS